MSAIFPRFVPPPVPKIAAIAALEAIVVGGGIGADRFRPAAQRLDMFGLFLLVVAGGALVLAARRPWLAFLLSLAAITAFSALGYSNAGPMFLGLLATLAAVADPARPRRSMAMGAITVATLVTRSFLQAGLAALNASVLAAAGWVVAALLLGHAVASHRASIAATEERARRAEETREAEARRRVAEERLRIARELHDVVSHSISVINVQAGVAAYVLDRRPEEARAALLTIKATSKEALREMRGILGILRGLDEEESDAPAPGLAQLGTLVERTVRAGVPTTLTVEGTARPLSPAIDLAAYRIIQEGLTNALRHAGPTAAVVTVTYGVDRLEIEVRDDGRGTTGRPSPEGSGYGLAGLRERAAAAGGALEAGPAPGGGFRVHACLPMESGDA